MYHSLDRSRGVIVIERVCSALLMATEAKTSKQLKRLGSVRAIAIKKVSCSCKNIATVLFAQRKSKRYTRKKQNNMCPAHQFCNDANADIIIVLRSQWFVYFRAIYAHVCCASVPPVHIHKVYGPFKVLCVAISRSDNRIHGCSSYDKQHFRTL